MYIKENVASTLKEYQNEKNEIYRVCGDEFMVISTDTSLDEFAKMKKVTYR